ncbi:Amino Acid-Polyamine-Organocation (APC) Family [Thraustotheca clavata]|uniref:Amino Acid-Polyamine-Organocation (APC) Family n=1 Tax=Thraustotheca clavata TaxID=74557 RepID=A0A1V9ZNH0_9STRA|nr:Amino Acid-Polyamine-Organocation (APC) Family [Thraustotheca clavata]
MVATGSRRELGVVAVALLTYFSVCAGPFGSEAIIAACGPCVGLIALCVFPIVYSFPVTMLFAELCSAFPVDSSFCTWVSLALGPSWGFYVGYWSWLASVIDATVYPCLVVDTFSINHNIAWSTRTLYRLGVAIAFTVPSLLGIKLVGKTLLWLSLFILLPFVVLTIISIPRVDPTNWTLVRAQGNWTQLIGLLCWNFRGFDATGAYAGAVTDPKRTFPQAMALALLMTVLSYFLPLLAVSGVNEPPYTTWSDGSYPVIAQAIGGAGLATWIALSNTASSFGLYVAETTSNGYRLAGMADMNLAPRFFAQRTGPTATPQRALLCILGISIAMCLFDFTTILGITNVLSSLTQLVENVAALRMRHLYPSLARSYQVGLSTCQLTVAMVVPLTLGTAIVFNQLLQSYTTTIMCSSALLLGMGLQVLVAQRQSSESIPLLHQDSNPLL